MMAGGIEITVEFPELAEIRNAFLSLPKNLSAKYMASALGQAVDPGFKLLKTLTPKGPTGNLRRSIRKKTKRYAKTGSGVALAGFTAPPRRKNSDLKSNEKGQHQGFLEFGTKERKAKGPVASSFKQRGQFTIARPRKLGKPPKNLFGAAGDRYAARYRSRLKVQTNPKYPKAFFKRAADGEVVKLGKMPVGGRTGVPPVKTAFERTRTQISAKLNSEMTKALNNAIKEMASPFRAGRGR